MTALMTFLSGVLANLLGYQVARFLAWKVLLWSLAVSIIPIVLTNFIYTIMQTVIALVNANVTSSGLQGSVLSLTGLAAWLAVQLRLQEALSLVLSAVMFRIALNMIPFIRV